MNYFWAAITGLGVPGLALGIFYMLFRALKFEFPKVPKNWVPWFVLLYMLSALGIALFAIHKFAPSTTILLPENKRAEDKMVDKVLEQGSVNPSDLADKDKLEKLIEAESVIFRELLPEPNSSDELTRQQRVDLIVHITNVSDYVNRLHNIESEPFGRFTITVRLAIQVQTAASILSMRTKVPKEDIELIVKLRSKFESLLVRLSTIEVEKYWIDKYILGDGKGTLEFQISDTIKQVKQPELKEEWSKWQHVVDKHRDRFSNNCVNLLRENALVNCYLNERIELVQQA